MSLQKNIARGCYIAAGECRFNTAISGDEDDVAVSAGDQVALGCVCDISDRGITVEVGYRDADAGYGDAVVFCQVDAGCVSTGGQSGYRVHVGADVVECGADSVVSLQTQVGGADVLCAAGGVDDGAQVTEDTDVGGGQVAKGYVVGGSEAQTAAGCSDGGCSVHGQDAGFGVEADCSGAAGANVYAATEGYGVGGFQGDVAGCADHVGADDDVAAGAVGVNKDVAGSIGFYGIAVCVAVFKGDAAVGRDKDKVGTAR